MKIFYFLGAESRCYNPPFLFAGVSLSKLIVKFEAVVFLSFGNTKAFESSGIEIENKKKFKRSENKASCG
jgi:hypothetical protein